MCAGFIDVPDFGEIVFTAGGEFVIGTLPIRTNNTFALKKQRTVCKTAPGNFKVK